MGHDVEEVELDHIGGVGALGPETAAEVEYLAAQPAGRNRAFLRLPDRERFSRLFVLGQRP